MVTEILKPYLEEHGALLSEKQLSQLESYARLLTEWNEKMNLTAIVDEEGIALKHFLDSLALLRYAEIPNGARVADVGTGAGFPGVVLKIARPDIELVLIDSLQKRLNFLESLFTQGRRTRDTTKSFGKALILLRRGLWRTFQCSRNTACLL